MVLFVIFNIVSVDENIHSDYIMYTITSVSS